MSYDHASRLLTCATRTIEIILTRSEFHSSDLWFAWGLLDVRIKRMQFFLKDQLDPMFLINWYENMRLLQFDFQHMQRCLYKNPLEKKTNAQLEQICDRYINLLLTEFSESDDSRKRKK